MTRQGEWLALARRLCAVALLAVCVWSSVTRAQAGDSSEYEQLVDKGIAEYRAGHWEESRSLFEQAHAINPNARTLRGLGLAAYEGRDYVACIEYLEEALADSRKPLTDKQRPALEKVIAEASSFVGRFTLQLEPANATLEVDGYEAKAKSGVLLLNAGDHELVASAAGYRRLTRHIAVRGGRSGTLELVLESESAPQLGGEARPTDHPPPPYPASESASTVGPIITMSAGGALLVGAGITALLAASDYDALEDGCANASACDPSLESKADRGETLQVASYVLLAAGTLTAAAGLTWLLLADDGEQPAPVALGCDARGCRGALRMAF